MVRLLPGMLMRSAKAVGPGTATQVLTSNGAGAEPSFQEIVSDAAAMALALG